MSAPIDDDAILRKASPDPNTGCWLWTEGDNGRGYGRLKRNGKSHQAHRFFYEMLVGPIPEGMTLDHKCRQTFCVNPDHLDPVTHVENVRRGIAGETTANRQRSKTHCPHGHAYDGDNLVIRDNGARGCRTCLNTRKRPPKPRRSAEKTHCRRGHALIGSNVKVDGRKNICLVCRRERDRRRRPSKTMDREFRRTQEIIG